MPTSVGVFLLFDTENGNVTFSLLPTMASHRQVKVILKHLSVTHMYYRTGYP